MCLVAYHLNWREGQRRDGNLTLESVILGTLTGCSGQTERPFWVCTKIRRAKLTLGDEDEIEAQIHGLDRKG